MSTTITAGNATNNGASIASDAAGTIEIKTGSTPTTAITVDTSQNVGIGTASPAVKLDVTGAMRSIVSGGTPQIYFNDGTYQTNIVGSGNAFKFIQSSTETMRIDGSGNVGIGTAPNAWGTSKAVQIGQGALWNYNNSTNAYLAANYYFDGSVRRYIANGQATEYLVNGDGTHRWYNAISGTAGGVVSFAERMQIDSSGNLLLNVTSTYSSSKISILGSGSGTWGITVKNPSSTTNNMPVFVSLNAAGGVVGYIDSSNTATTYVTTSDYRLKENIAPMVGALDKVSALKPVTYDWKDGGSSQGFIAHELQEVVPECVTGEKDAVNEDGSIKPQGIDTSFLVATLTAAIQEQQAMIEELKIKVATLEAK